MLIGFVLCLLIVVPQVDARIEAAATLYRDGSNTSIGILSFVQENATSPVVITGTLTSLFPNSSQGFHVHTIGVSEMFPNCTASLGHFNPYNTGHGGRVTDIMLRHVGDLGNLMTDGSGTVLVDISDSIIQFYNATQNIANRTIVVHAMEDDLGLGNHSLTNVTGNAGGRVACGLIIVKSSTDSNTTSVPMNTTSTTMSTTTRGGGAIGTIHSSVSVFLFVISLSFIVLFH